MNVQEAVQEITKLQCEMNASAANSEVAAARYQGHMILYNSAVQMGDDKEAETQRLTLHAQLDAILDAGYEIYSRKRRITEIQRTVTD